MYITPHTSISHLLDAHAPDLQVSTTFSDWFTTLKREMVVKMRPGQPKKDTYFCRFCKVDVGGRSHADKHLEKIHMGEKRFCHLPKDPEGYICPIFDCDFKVT